MHEVKVKADYSEIYETRISIRNLVEVVYSSRRLGMLNARYGVNGQYLCIGTYSRMQTSWIVSLFWNICCHGYRFNSQLKLVLQPITLVTSPKHLNYF